MLTDVNPVTRVAGHQLYGTHHQIGVGQLPMNKSVSVWYYLDLECASGTRTPLQSTG